MRLCICILVSLLISACETSGRYAQRHDSMPKHADNTAIQADPIPIHEPYSRGGNKPYQVFGLPYTPLSTGKGYEKIGEASWYGQKFHGHLTSNGEVYDMFAMSAAHKTLPLPSFVRVTNLANQKQVVVRVNDRGPFHGGRVIDLSYGAAYKLDMLKTGTAKVKLEVIHIDATGNTQIGKRVANNPSNYFVQVLASGNQTKLRELGEGLESLFQIPSLVVLIDDIYRLRLGPLTDANATEQLLQELKTHGYEQSFKIFPN